MMSRMCTRTLIFPPGWETAERVRILGIDPGSRLTGFAVIDADGDVMRACGFGVIRTGTGEMPERLGAIFAGVGRVIREQGPEVLAIESIFLARNPQSALKLGQARGAAICAAFENGLPVFEYAPRAVKQAVVGTGKADKLQVAHMMQKLLRIEDALAADAADALAVAVCHAHSQRLKDRLAAFELRAEKRWR
jgi:crossover junction endodeoxyribonuclease RuvC